MIFLVGALMNAITGGKVKATETGGQLGFKPQYNLEQHNKRAVEGMKTLPRRVGQREVVAMKGTAARRQQEAKLLGEYAAAVKQKDAADLQEYKTRADYQQHKMKMALEFAATDATYGKAVSESKYAQQTIEAEHIGYVQACENARKLIMF